MHHLNPDVDGTERASDRLSRATRSRDAEAIRDRFDTNDAANKYASSLTGTKTDQREQRCLADLLAWTDLPAGATLLDLPCGTGRLLPFLTGLGYRVTEADSSPHMVELARRFAFENNLSASPGRFLVQNAFATDFGENAFDVVVCNRLLHHFPRPEDRRAILHELARISAGWVIVSFFNLRTLDAMTFWTKQMVVERERPTDRVPISPRTLVRDAREAGLVVERILSTRPGVSKQCYAVMRIPASSLN